MSALRTIRLVAIRDFQERLRSRAFQISTAFTLLFVVAIVLVPAFFSGRSVHWEIGVVGLDADRLAAAVGAAAPDNAVVKATTYPDEDAAIAALDDGDVDVVATPERVVVTPSTPTALSGALAGAIGLERLVSRAAELGVDPDALASLLAETHVPVEQVSPATAADAEHLAAAFFASVLLFIAIVTYGQWILLGVVEEKANRVVEVVLGAVRPRHLLTGKIIGIGLLGLVQLAILAGAAAIAGAAAGTSPIPAGFGAIVGTVTLWFVLGYALYATAYAAAGSLVSRTEDAQNVAFPLTLVLMVGYFAAAFSLGGPGVVVRIASFVPVWAPVTMPVRMVAGTAAPWEVLISVALTLATIYLLTRMAGRLYRGGLLRTRAKAGLREAWASGGR